MEDFIIITPENIKGLSSELDSGKGNILFLSGIGSSKIRFPEAEISVYFKRKVKDGWLHSRDEQNRDYTLREKRIYPEIKKEDYDKATFRERLNIDSMLQHKSASSFFEKLDVGNYEFQIHSAMINGRGILGYEIALYSKNLEAAIEYALSEGVSKVNRLLEKDNKPLIPQKEIASIMDYIRTDLKSGETLKKNIRAGMDADAYCGL
jgi:hypothetical protein